MPTDSPHDQRHNTTVSPQAALEIIAKLAAKIEQIKHPAAKACVLWLVGQYAGSDSEKSTQSPIPGVAIWAPDTLRRVAKTFSSEVPLSLPLISLDLVAEVANLVAITH